MASSEAPWKASHMLITLCRPVTMRASLSAMPMAPGIEAWRRQRLPEIVARVFLKEGTRLLVDLCCLPSRPQIRDVSVPFGLQSRDVHGSPLRLLFDARPLGACPRSAAWFQQFIR